jgi:predicted amino acid-binding ACT domain protein
MSQQPKPKVPKSNNDNIFWSITKLGNAIIKSFVILLILSIIFAILPPIINNLQKKINSSWDSFKPNSYENNIFLTISSSLLAASILTATLNVVETKQKREDFQKLFEQLKKEGEDMNKQISISSNEVRQSYENILEELKSYTERTIRDIKNSSADSLIQNMVGDPVIFNEIKTHIIRKNYIRDEYYCKK